MRSIEWVAAAMLVLGSAALAMPAQAAEPDEPQGSEPQEPDVAEPHAEVSLAAKALPSAEQESVVSIYQLARHLADVAKLGEHQGGKAAKELSRNMGKECGAVADAIRKFAGKSAISLNKAAPRRFLDEITHLGKEKRGRGGFDRAFIDLIAQEAREGADALSKAIAGSDDKGFRQAMRKALDVLEKYATEAEGLQAQRK
jgi:hypothetical protein